MFVSIASSPASRSGSYHGVTSTHVPSARSGNLAAMCAIDRIGAGHG